MSSKTIPVFDPPSFLQSLQRDAEFGDRIAAVRKTPARPAEYLDAGPDLHPRLHAQLLARGMSRLYRHQALAFQAAQRGEHFTVITPTASGKSLTYVLPLLNRLLAEPDSKALLLFPIKALAQDQLALLQGWMEALWPAEGTGKAAKKPGPRAAIYDGDTSAYQRGKLKADPPSVVITNPDMLHLGLLPYHAAWGRFLGSLKYVVVDEAHTYRGVFGAHAAMILRRLRRLCRFYGSDPQFICLSATIANPEEFSGKLTGLASTVIAENGAPSGERSFCLWNPQASPYREGTELFGRLLRGGFKTIAFTKARKITELMGRWCVQAWPDLKDRFRAYRAGYLPEERRAIERQLFSGELDGVLSTSALELGIDVGGLDACVLVGYPGTMISTLQRAGRVGRAGQSSLVFLIGLQDAMDQYFMAHPDFFFAKPTEHALIPVQNRVVVGRHLQAAAEECPLEGKDAEFFGPGLPAACEALWQEGRLRKSDEGRFHSSQRGAAREINIRSAGEAFRIAAFADPSTSLRAGASASQSQPSVALAKEGRTIGRIEVPRVYRDCHPGAVYLHAGAQYLVRELDETTREVRAEEADLDYYTEPRGEDRIEILKVKKRKDWGHVSWCFGEVQASEQVKGYVKKHISSQEVLGEASLEMPVHTYQTEAAWWVLPLDWRKEFAELGFDFAGSIHALEHGQIALLPLFALCDRWDLGGVSYWAQPQLDQPAVFVYDGQAGGAALAEKGFDIVKPWLEAVANLLDSCPCEEGCPACIQSPKCGNGNKPLDKLGASELCRRLIATVGEGKETPVPPAHPLEKVEPPKPIPTPPTSPEATSGFGPVPAHSMAPVQPMAPLAVPSASPQSPANPNIVFFDLETQFLAAEVGGWDRKDAMKISVAVTYSSRSGKFKQYTEATVPKLVEELHSADLVVGFNHKNFDYAVLQPYCPDKVLQRLPSLDLLEHVATGLGGKRLKLDTLAKATLNSPKSADGLQAVAWFREGRLAELLQYCQQDVAITRDLWEFGRKYGYLLYEDLQGNLMRVAVKW